MPLPPGTCLGPYEILAPLGAGGMGEVYRARDTRVDRPVALKVLPEEFLEGEERRSRFEREAKLLASLNHPGIATLYSFEEIPSSSSSSSRSTPMHILAMELLEGETVRFALIRGPIPGKKAVGIAAQLADALASAHEKGIVHRDVKPENVFLTKEGRAKLLDFGIARQQPPAAPADTATPTATAVSAPGTLVGTAAYMSPEQARGEVVDFRSDQFSLGVVLYEMLTGKRPFGGATPTDTLAAILRDEPESLEEAAPSVPAPVRWIVERCLAKEAAGRYESTRDLARELGTWEKSAEIAPEGRRGRRESRRRRPGRGTVLAVAVIAIVVAVAAVRVVRNRAASPITATGKTPGLDPKRVVVAPFENRTGDATLEPIARMSAEWVTEGLSGIKIDVVPSADVFDAPAAKETPNGTPRESPRKLAERTGAGVVVSGAFYLEGSGVRLQAQVSDMTSGRLLHALPPASAPRANPMPAIDAIRKQVRDFLGVRLGSQAGDLANETVAPRYEAYVEFLLGAEKIYFSFSAAEAHFRRALEIDPAFVNARLLLVSILRDTQRYPDAARELEPLEKRRSGLSPAHGYVVDALRAQLSGRNDDALAAARSAVTLAPGDVEALFDLSSVAFKGNRPAEGVEALTRPARWDLFLNSSRSWARLYFRRLSKGYHVLGRHEEELSAARRGRGVYPSDGSLVVADLRALIALGRLDEADRLIAESLTHTEFASRHAGLLQEAAVELRTHGHAAEARRAAERCVAQVREKPSGAVTLWDRHALADCLCVTGMWTEAVLVYEGLEKERPREDPTWRGRRALAAHRAGDVATAARIEDELRRLDRPYLFGEHLLYLALLAAQRGERERAVSLLRQALVQGWGGNGDGIGFQAHRTAFFDPLRGYPPFEELVKPKG